MEDLINTNALDEMLKRVQHDKKKYVIPNQVLNLALKQVQGLSNSIYRFRNLEFGNDNELIAFALVGYWKIGIVEGWIISWERESEEQERG